MTVTATPARASDRSVAGWDGFNSGIWQKEIDVRDFIQQNYEPYHGDEAFLAPVTARTQKIWDTLKQLFIEERKKGVLDISQIPSSITAHAPGYIDRDQEIIVGLQTDAPLKRAIMPNGGCGCRQRSRPTAIRRIRTWSRRSRAYRKTHNDGVFDAYTADIRKCRSSHVLTAPDPTAAAASSATTAASRSTVSTA
jgi:formate C-acetyltransferase